MTHLVHLTPLLFNSGDRMTREDFLARWEQMPEVKFAELIDGVVYMPSPVSHLHSNFHGCSRGSAAGQTLRERSPAAPRS